ncbi:MAG: peptidoglycan DD-metalloendopeptidase family protein [Chitinophagales bacterium]
MEIKTNTKIKTPFDFQEPIHHILKYSFLFVLFILLVGKADLFAQEKKDLEKQKTQLAKDIALTRKLLKNTQNNQTLSINDLKLLQQQVHNREKMIHTVQQQLDILNISLTETDYQIDSVSTVLEELRDEYAELIRHAYLSNNAYNRLLFLFSADSFNEAYQRLKYLQYYTSHRKNQVGQIELMKKELLENRVRLESEKEEKKGLLVAEQQQRLALKVEEEQKNEMVKKLKQKESYLKKKLTSKKQAIEELDRQIRAIIEKVTAEETPIDNLPNRKMTADLLKLSADFKENQGKLPWPVDQGIITGKFGKQQHPILKHITLTNNGLDIATKKGEVARALFEGKVSNTLYSPTFQWAVIVKHGEYFTVYSNLEEVQVSKGDEITTRQAIGTIYTDVEEGKTEVHLEVWKGNGKLNPIEWIYKK